MYAQEELVMLGTDPEHEALGACVIGDSLGRNFSRARIHSMVHLMEYKN